jgi:protein arginine kinase
VLEDLASHAAPWACGSARDSDVVISSRVRLARNVAGYPFLTRAAASQQAEIEQVVRDAVLRSRCAPDIRYCSLPDLTPSQRQLLRERHLISRELAEAEYPCGMAYGADERLSVMVNEEDHVRIQGLAGGFELRQTWDRVNAADSAVEGCVVYAFSPDLGYLTACPTNVGTGIRVSVMLHLPALSLMGELQKVFASAAKIDFAVRGAYGERSEALGDFYQVSNQKTLGRSEEEIIAKLEAVIPQVVGYERRVRRALLKQDRNAVEDRVFRAYGLLRYARTMAAEEALHLLSYLRLGANTGLLPQFKAEQINPLFMLSQTGHLEQTERREMTAEVANAARAELLRRWIGGDGVADKGPCQAPGQ